MQKQIQQIKEFQTTFGLGMNTNPTFPDKSVRLLRHNLINEEVMELHDAAACGDKIETLDAIVDIMYVLLGAACEYGMIDLIESAFTLVHENNMSKKWPDGLVHRRFDGKILKPEGFKKVDLTPLFNATAA